MTSDQLRTALRELNGERDLTLAFAEVPSPATGSHYLEIRRAILIPDEADHLVKVTDGKAVYVVDAERGGVVEDRVEVKKNRAAIRGVN